MKLEHRIHNWRSYWPLKKINKFCCYIFCLTHFVAHEDSIAEIMSPRREEFFKLLVLALCATCRAQSDNIGCFVSGGCVNGLVSGLTIVPTIGECVDFCTSTSGCQYFSYEPTDDVCLALEECPEVSTDNCLDCISGDSTCPDTICALPGEPQKT